MDIAWLTVLFAQQLHRVHQQILDIQEESHQCQVLIQSLPALMCIIYHLTKNGFTFFFLSDY